MCSFHNTPLVRPSVAPTPGTVFEIPGTLVVFQGSACAKSTQSGARQALKIDQSLPLPAYATQATVVLNGWEVAYLNGDHHIAGLGTLIDTIRIERNTLRWQATGLLSDQNFDDAYQWCYHFTVIAWNPATINLIADHTDVDCTTRNTSVGNVNSALNKNTKTALASFASYIQNPAFASQKKVSILPRGFGFDWRACEEDHHLLQMAYAIGHPEVFIEAGKGYNKRTTTVPIASGAPSQVGNGFVSWETSAIYKDNDNRRDYIFGELVTALSGTDLGIIEPPFSILPFNDGAQGSQDSDNVEMKTFVIDNIPYNQAIPVLTGWDIGYLTDDQHVKQIGIWIDKIHYDKNPTQPTGKLTYTVAYSLHDDNNSPGFYARPKVTILGFQPTGGKVIEPRK